MNVRTALPTAKRQTYRLCVCKANNVVVISLKNNKVAQNT